MKFAFAGDRQIAVNILKLLIRKGHSPLALLVTNGEKSTHKGEIIVLANLTRDLVFEGKEFCTKKSIDQLQTLDLDYIIGIHFPLIIPQEVLNIPRIGFLNLHPAYLPYNKGWHTPSWAILDGTPYGATLHFMTNLLDEGDIIHQEQMEVLPSDTANSLYERVLILEEKVFNAALPLLVLLTPKRISQTEEGTAHSKKDLIEQQELNLNESATFEVMINKLRALTTNTIEEAAYFRKDGKKYKVQIHIEEENDEN